MSKAVAKSTSPQRKWSIDAAFRYIRRVTGLPDGRALRSLNQAIEDGELPVACIHRVNGKLRGQGVVPVDFWGGDHLKVVLVGGRAAVDVRRALVPGEHSYFVSQETARSRWSAPTCAHNKSKHATGKRPVGRPPYERERIVAKGREALAAHGVPPKTLEELVEWTEKECRKAKIKIPKTEGTSTTMKNLLRPLLAEVRMRLTN